MTQQDKDREAFEHHIIDRQTSRWGQEFYDEHWKTWQAARRFYAPKLTEKEAVEAAAIEIWQKSVPKYSNGPMSWGQALNESFVYLETSSDKSGEEKTKKIYRDIATSALRATGVRFKEEA